jgi:beta-glucuronidase
MVMVSDVQQLLDMGCNFVRGSHYPQDARFLDLCDEAGICVWSESIGWQHTADHLTDPHFVGAQLAHIDEMVAVAYNHPAVIMWGILNESHSHDPACRPGYATLLGRLRELDGARPVTYATNHPFEDVCLDLVDILAVNCYPGWYGSEIARIPEEIDRIVAHLDAHGHADKPLMISEIGAGAIRGWRDWNGARWSEQYQAQLLETVIRYLFQDRDRAAGLALWQFCDCRTSEAVQKILGRPRGFNNKGVVDEYRRPKLGYEIVKREFHALD